LIFQHDATFAPCECFFVWLVLHLHALKGRCNAGLLVAKKDSL
jgi:hypothetical protein